MIAISSMVAEGAPKVWTFLHQLNTLLIYLLTIRQKEIGLILGTMPIGEQVNEEGAKEMLHYFFEHAAKNIDSAIIYSFGKTEKIIGKVLTAEEKQSTHI